MLRLNWRYLVCVATLVGLVGCGQTGGDRPKTVAVTGTITQNGQPVDGAIVTFHPTSGGQGASGKTDSSGRYELTTFEAGDGAVPGSYRVTVTKQSGGAAAAGPALDPSTMTPEQMQAYAEQGKTAATGGGEAEDLLPSKYKSPEDSGLTAEVTEGGKNDFPFDLTE